MLPSVARAPPRPLNGITLRRYMPPNPSKISGLTKADFRAERVPVIDALVAFVATGGKPAPAVQEQIDARGQSRWYPTAGGSFVKMPYQGDPVPMEHFRVEPGGWDHEHCDQCGERIEVQQECWITSDADFALICDSCYRKLR
ncbi:MAG TPA: hypothetical protein VGR35_23315 [Tepidisphaeraceae bacterium]|nr:hypothetical protein [Tepidisphaeraceae bacterium]